MANKAKELAIHEKDTGSSEIQIAQLTTQFESRKIRCPYHELLILLFYCSYFFPATSISFFTTLNIYFLKFNFDITSL